MKKYLLGFFAVILAISFSAFTKIEPAKKSQATYYYYRVNSTTNRVESSSDLINSTAKTNATFVSDHPADVCSGNGQDCTRGFTSQIQSGDFPFSGPGNDSFQKP